MQQNQCAIEMPEEYKAIMEFKNYHNQVVAPFVVYADLETLLNKDDSNFTHGGTIIKQQHHEPYSIAYYLKCSYDNALSYYKAKRGTNCVDWFVQELELITNRVATILNNPRPMVITVEDEADFIWARRCHICDNLFNFSTDIVVRDHCHFTGRYRSPAHQQCNLAFKNRRVIPIVFHNLTHYDAHFLIEKVANGFSTSGNVKVIPINSEKYISFVKTLPSADGDYNLSMKLKFIDSFRFMASSLGSLAKLIPTEKKGLLREQFSNFDSNDLYLLETKGVLCYDYIDSWQKLNETSLPPISAFHSILTNEDISEQQYNYANQIWSKFNIQTIGEYTDLYLKVDVLLLATVFENFRETCLKLYKLDPANYYTAPGLSFDAMLR